MQVRPFKGAAHPAAQYATCRNEKPSFELGLIQQLGDQYPIERIEIKRRAIAFSASSLPISLST